MTRSEIETLLNSDRLEIKRVYTNHNGFPYKHYQSNNPGFWENPASCRIDLQTMEATYFDKDGNKLYTKPVQFETIIRL